MRLTVLTDGNLTPAQAELRRRIQAGPRGVGATRGPFEIFLHAPAFGDIAQQLGAHCRFGTSLPARLSELVILITAAHWRCQYEWSAHRPIAERAGLSPAVIDVVHACGTPDFAEADERAVYAFVTELHTTLRVSNTTYQDLHAFLGDAGTVELLGILGYYTMIATMLNVFESPPAAGQAPPFPDASPGAEG
ncbi:carboxymuconolactone decarboxylase family protein [Microvirga antarctica]|uniref:carboxymuconolactone decarboxylase family protein n=1 Tax=Microvirga antarctica TaxID=2819233 RepID=UPI001B3184FB|nr:carboxymuconolactone decarboxylase family protein [Microvirga antarctica]